MIPFLFNFYAINILNSFKQESCQNNPNHTEKQPFLRLITRRSEPRASCVISRKNITY